LEDFLHACGAEGAPIHRFFTCTITGQPAIQKLMTKRPSYFRLMQTPVAEAAATDMVYIPQNVFLGTEADMSEIAAAIRKVQHHFATRAAGARLSTEVIASI
jgi:dTDP-4-amino-4,6-dideoxygalactose transaminase